MKELKVKILEDEVWYGGQVALGHKMPFDRESEYRFDTLTQDAKCNPFSGAFTSNKGRYVYFGGDGKIEIADGEIFVESDDIDFSENHGDLKGAYLALAKKHFVADKIDAPLDTMLSPQFCTWVYADINIDDEKLIAYAESIVAAGFPRGIIIIDDGWMVDYGDWRFDPAKFKNPKETIARLHELGFKVELWLVPFVNKTAKDYESLKDNGAFILERDGSVRDYEWWNCKSAVLDFTSNFADEWLTDVLGGLTETYGVDGFKFDGGAAEAYYNCRANKDVTPMEHTALWAKFGNRYEYSEIREGFNYQGQHFVLRLQDKNRNYSRTSGLGALVPQVLAAGVCGYPYSCPDMIGGGQISDFRGGKENDYDPETIARFCEASALMPGMQFSFDYWNKDENLKNEFVKYAALRCKYGELIKKIAAEAKNTYAPMARYLEYEFPNQGYEKNVDEFMLGDELFVSPVIEPGVTQKDIRLPFGFKWKYVPTGETYDGGDTVTVQCPQGTLPYFEKI